MDNDRPALTKQTRFTEKCLTKIKTGVKRGESSASSKHLLEKNYDLGQVICFNDTHGHLPS